MTPKTSTSVGTPSFWCTFALVTFLWGWSLSCNHLQKKSEYEECTSVPWCPTVSFSPVLRCYINNVILNIIFMHESGGNGLLWLESLCVLCWSHCLNVLKVFGGTVSSWGLFERNKIRQGNRIHQERVHPLLWSKYTWCRMTAALPQCSTINKNHWFRSDSFDTELLACLFLQSKNWQNCQ